MNMDRLQDQLLRAARKNPPGDGVPYAFERRIMHRLGSRRPETVLDLWSGALWRGAIACMAVTLICGVWSYSAHQRPSDPPGDFSQELSSTVFASMDQTGGGNW